MGNPQKTKLRSLTIGSERKVKTETYEYAGQKFEVRQPNLRERSDIRRKATQMEGEQIEFNLFEFMIWAVIKQTYVPESEERVFEDEDYKDLCDIPAGGWFDELAEIASGLCNVETEGKKDDAKKSSSKTGNVKVTL